MLAIAKIGSILLLTVAACSCAQVSKDHKAQNFSNLTDIINYREYEGTFGTQYEFEVNKDIEYTYVFTNVTKLLQNRTARIVVETINAKDSNPVFIVVRQKKDVMAWEHPLILSTRMSVSAEYQKVSRTICPTEYYNSISPENVEGEEENLLVTASTSSLSNVTVKLSAEFVNDFYLSLSEENEITVSPSEPSFYGYLFSDDVETILLTAYSEDEACTTISVQNIDCPIYDLENTIKFEGQWETMTHKGGMTIKRKANQTGFYVVFIVNSQDDECTEKQNTGDKNGNKLISFKLVPQLSKHQYLLAILLPLFLCILLYVLCGVIMYRKHRNPCLSENLRSNENSIQEDLGRENSRYQQQPSPSKEDRNVNDNLNHGVTTETISCNDAVRASRKKSHLYLWITILAGIFYFVPAIQRVVTHQVILQETGNYDLCYYNYHCAHPLDSLNLTDFNHVYSNIGYILLGLLFIFVTKSEKRYYEKQNSNKQDPDLPHEFGLYYAMGVSLISEGLLSGAYHICPRGSNFQFDTTFMYVTALLCMVNIYQNRHQHIYANATSIFMFLGSVTFFVMLGNILSHFYLSIFIAICQILVSLVITLQLYHNGKISKGWKNVKEVFSKWREGCRPCKKPSCGLKLAFLLIVNAINWTLAILGVLEILGGVANILLAIFIGNLLLPFAYHIYIKHQDVRNREIAETQQTTEPGKGQKPFLLLKRVASDIAGGASSSQTIDTESNDLNGSGTQQNSPHTDEMTGNVVTSRTGNCFKPYWNIICRKLFEPNFYFVMTILFWIPALYFFISNTSSWEKTPAMSRNKNEPCIFLNFYDNHDIWHFLSAGGLFFSLMVFLTLNNHRLDTL